MALTNAEQQRRYRARHKGATMVLDVAVDELSSYGIDVGVAKRHTDYYVRIAEILKELAIEQLREKRKIT